MMLLGQVFETIRDEFVDLTELASAVRVVLRLFLAAALGALLGFERESVGKAAGVRTLVLVALGSALFVIVPHELGASDDAISRVTQGLVAGIGFLGAGAIVKGRPGEDILGLTTAATIWMTAAIGMAVGLGRGVTAVIAAVAAFIVLRFFPGGGPDHSSDKKSP